MFQSFFKIYLNKLSVLLNCKYATKCLLVSLRHLQIFSIAKVLDVLANLLLL